MTWVGLAWECQLVVVVVVVVVVVGVVAQSPVMEVQLV